jgi:hypothetical protein
MRYDRKPLSLLHNNNKDRSSTMHRLLSTYLLSSLTYIDDDEAQARNLPPHRQVYPGGRGSAGIGWEG